MVTREGQVKITDFGLAHLADRARLTRTAGVGTPAYMSPEQAQAQPVNRRTDIWSLGVVLYVMATGRTPFEGDREEAVLYAILPSCARADHRAARRRAAGVGPDRRQGAREEPDDRYQHVDDLIVDLVGAEEADGVRRVGAGKQSDATSAPRWTMSHVRALAMVTAYPRRCRWCTSANAGADRHYRCDGSRSHPDSLPPESRPVAISPDGKHVAYWRGFGGAISFAT